MVVWSQPPCTALRENIVPVSVSIKYRLNVQQLQQGLIINDCQNFRLKRRPVTKEYAVLVSFDDPVDPQRQACDKPDDRIDVLFHGSLFSWMDQPVLLAVLF